jgi:hypothetical protein
VDGFSQACGVASAYLFCDPIGDRCYEHFVKSSPDKVFQMASGEFTLPFQVSAVLLVIFEILCVWASTRILKAPSLAGVHHEV